MAAEGKIPEFEPPQACVARIMKNVLPSNMQVTKDARAAFTRAAGIFIFYLTNCAHEFSRESKRSTIATGDVFKALKELDFDEIEPQLTAFLENYRKEMAASVSKRAASNATGNKKRNAETANLDGAEDAVNDDDVGDNDEENPEGDMNPVDEDVAADDENDDEVVDDEDEALAEDAIEDEAENGGKSHTS